MGKIERRDLIKTIPLIFVAGCTGNNTEIQGPEYGDWFNSVSNFEGTTDQTGNEEVEVKVGTETERGFYGFDPPAVRVSKNTKVVWKWTGQGGGHNVVAKDDEFQSEYAKSEGYEFTHSFQDTGTYLYYCKPHRSLGMKGAVYVEK